MLKRVGSTRVEGGAIPPPHSASFIYFFFFALFPFLFCLFLLLPVSRRAPCAGPPVSLTGGQIKMDSDLATADRYRRMGRGPSRLAPLSRWVQEGVPSAQSGKRGTGSDKQRATPLRANRMCKKTKQL